MFKYLIVLFFFICIVYNKKYKPCGRTLYTNSLNAFSMDNAIDIYSYPLDKEFAKIGPKLSIHKVISRFRHIQHYEMSTNPDII